MKINFESKEKGNAEGKKLEKAPEKKKTQVDFVRHSKATYSTYKEMVNSDDPGKKFDHRNQVFPDLSSGGIELAKEQARLFFEKFDPEKEQLFFVSSNEARALETAGIYREEALAEKFTILKPEHSRSSISEDHLDGDVRMIDTLSLNLPNVIVSSLLNPKSSRHEVNYDALDPKEAEMYKKLQEEIDKDNKGSFAENFIAYGDLVKKYVPSFETAEDLYNRNFKNMIRLFKFAEKKTGESSSKKQIRILAFGHENQLLVALNKYFGEHGINNCEVLSAESGADGEIKGNFRGKEIQDLTK